MKKFIFIISLILASIKVNNANKLIDVQIVEKKDESMYDTYFQKTLEFIKLHEGFRNKPYNDTNNFPTIGYGFIIRYLNPKFRHYISRKDADSILVKKIMFNIKYAKKVYPKLNKFQQLAIAHLAYCKGFGTIQKHKIHRYLKNNTKISKNIWIIFGKPEIKSNLYRNNRRFEYKLYNYKE